MGDDTDLEFFAGMQSEQPEDEKQECACKRCTAIVYPDDYTFPYCPECYVHCD